MPNIDSYSLSIRELTETLIRSNGITSGHWEAGFQLKTTAMVAEVNGGGPMPSAIIQIANVNLVRVEKPTPSSVDASAVSIFPDRINA